MKLTRVTRIWLQYTRSQCPTTVFNKNRDIPYSQKNFDGELNLAVWVDGVETAKLKSANIILPPTRNDVMHAVVLFALIPCPFTQAVHVVNSVLVLFLVQLGNSCSNTSSERGQRSIVNRPEVPLPNLNSLIFFFMVE